MPGPSRYVVYVDDEAVEVEINAAGQAVIGDQVFDVIKSGDGRLLVRAIGASDQHVVTLAGQARPLEGHIHGQRVRLEVQSATEAALDEALGSGRAGGGDGMVRAPMPGRIVKLLVQAGDPIEVDTPVVIVEAMKMENELGAPRAGTVTEVHVAVGDAVEAGALLVSVQSADEA